MKCSCNREGACYSGREGSIAVVEKNSVPEQALVEKWCRSTERRVTILKKMGVFP
jgi:hypothetical protein